MPPEPMVIIPARWASSRFPGKPLAPILGRPMIQWVYEQCQQAQTIKKVVVATDDERIQHVVQSFGGTCMMTPSSLATGTERVAYVAREVEASMIINVQGDEPLINPGNVDHVARELAEDTESVMATLAYRIKRSSELMNPQTARVILDKHGRALYFSRAAIPYARDVSSQADWPATFPYYNHVGIYAYRRDFLLSFHELESTALETAEKLEQLRVLANGFRIKVGITDGAPVCVDVPADIERVEQKAKEMGLS